jgi:hypothetical protein
VTIFSVAVGDGATCTQDSGNGSLQYMADQTGGSCTTFLTGLPDIIDAVLSTKMTNVELTIDGGMSTFASTNPTEFNGPDSTSITATVDELSIGEHVVCIKPTGEDSNSATACACVTINVINQLPDAMDDSADTQEGTAVTINVLENDSDPDGDIMTVVSAIYPTSGTVIINTDRTIQYTPSPGFCAVDIYGDQATATVMINVIPNVCGCGNPDTDTDSDGTPN